MPGARFFDRQEGMWIDTGTGVADYFLPGLKYHHHELGACFDTVDGYRRWWCTDCDAFAWQPPR